MRRLQRPADLRGGLARGMTRLGIAVSALVTITTAFPSPVNGQDMPVPVSIQIPLLTKILAFDRTFSERVGEDFVIAIVYQSGFRASVLARNQVAEAADKIAFGGAGQIPVRYVFVDVDQSRSWRWRLANSAADVIYVAPLRAFDLSLITTASRSLDMITYTGVPGYVASGVAVGLDLFANRPKIVVNLAASYEEGCDFTSELLKLARIE